MENTRVLITDEAKKIVEQMKAQLDAGVSFYMDEDQYEYWKHTHLTVDITKGRGSSFSVEIPLGLRFVIKSRLLTEAENEHFRKIEAEKNESLP